MTPEEKEAFERFERARQRMLAEAAIFLAAFERAATALQRFNVELRLAVARLKDRDE